MIRVKNKISQKLISEREWFAKALLGVLLLTLASSCGGNEKEKEVCDCLPGSADLSLIGKGIPVESPSPASISVTGGNITFSETLMVLKEVELILEGDGGVRRESLGSVLMDIIHSNAKVPETIQITTGTATLVALRFTIDDLDDKDHDGSVDINQQPSDVSESEYSDMIGKSIFLQGTINLEGEAPVEFTFKTDLSSRAEIPFSRSVLISNGPTGHLLVMVDLAKIFNSIDTDPTKGSVIELRDAALSSGGLLDPKVTNGGEIIARAIEEAIGHSFSVFNDENGNGLPEPNELINDGTTLISTPVVD